LNLNLVDPALTGLVKPATVSNEITILMFMLALPVLTLLIGRMRPLIIVAVAVAAVGRYMMVADVEISRMIAASIAVGGGLLYIAFLVQRRARILPYMFIFALAIDQLFRAAGDTLDGSWSTKYESNQLVLSIVAVIISVIVFVSHERANRNMEESSTISPDRGLMSIWSGIGFGALLFLELSLLTMPNAIAGRANMDYTALTPAVMAATLLPIIPWVRGQARGFVSLFDSSVRGWVWMLLLALLLVFGVRFEGIVAGATLVIAQFFASMLWFWLTRARAQRERNFTGLWLVFGVLIFALLAVFDVFTYEYAFVRDFAPELDFLNNIIPPLLRGFRGLGLAVILFSTFLAVMPMVQTRRRIAWVGGDWSWSLVALGFIVAAGYGAGYLARPPIIQGVSQPETIRVGTYNIHGGYNEFFYSDLEDIEFAIRRSGANVVLLQEVEAGRLTSFGVDQTLWLARRLKMDRRFYPTNEGLQGLAILSNIEIVFDDGELLDSIGVQSGLQRVQVRPDSGVVTIYNTWLDPLLDTGGSTLEELEQSQGNQLSQIFRIIVAQHPPDGQLGRTVFGGTFNTVPDSPLVQRMIENGFIDQFAGRPLELSATFWRTGQRSRLDYLWTTRNLQVITAGVIDLNASDHRLAVIEIRLR
jgi:endonuclease/exonuclease/phosphatase family metal-dependent hydrolase